MIACPRCVVEFDGQPNTIHFSKGACPYCGWKIPTYTELMTLLDEARNYVTNQALRQRITMVVPPTPRDWPSDKDRFAGDYIVRVPPEPAKTDEQMLKAASGDAARATFLRARRWMQHTPGCRSAAFADENDRKCTCGLRQFHDDCMGRR